LVFFRAPLPPFSNGGPIEANHQTPTLNGRRKQMVSLDNGRSYHHPANLVLAELEPSMKEGDKVRFLELYFAHAHRGHRLAVG